MTKDGKTKVKPPSSVLSTAEAISVLFNSGILAQHFGSGEGHGGGAARARSSAPSRRRAARTSRPCASTARPWRRARGGALERVLRRGQGEALRDRSRASLEQVHLFPVRHHSPRIERGARGVPRRGDARGSCWSRGPSDATALIDVLVDAETRPPVAILGYRTDGTPGSSLWPFAAYSPEYVALAWATKHGREAAFIDVPVGVRPGLARRTTGAEDIEADRRARRDDRTSTSTTTRTRRREPGTGRGDASRGRVRRPRGVRAGARVPIVRGVLGGVVRGAGVRAGGVSRGAARVRRAGARGGPRPLHRARDAFMARRILARIARGRIAPRRGSRSSSARPTRRRSRRATSISTLERACPTPVPSAVTLIPFSFPRLAEQLGYGAGNRAPQYYQRAHDAGCDFRRATLEVLVEFTEHLRLRGFMASLADTIEAYRLAVTLADIRGKAEPGLDEVREATIATMCRGDADPRRRLPLAQRHRPQRRPRRATGSARTRSRKSSGARSQRAAPARRPTRPSRSRSS